MIDDNVVQQKPACIILAGGSSVRMGQNKALLTVPRQPRITFAGYLVSLSLSVTDEVILVARDAAMAYRYVRSLPPQPLVICDRMPNQGPLMGLYSGLSRSQASHSVVMAVDLPELQPELLAFLATQARGEELVVPLVNGIPQVLLALYPRSILDVIEMCLQEGRHDLRILLDLLPVRYLEEEQLRQYDPQLRSFINVNTPQDLEKLVF